MPVDPLPTYPLLALRRVDAATAIGVGVGTFDSMNTDGRLGPPGVSYSKRMTVWPVDELRRWINAGAPPRHEWLRQTSDKVGRDGTINNGFSDLTNRCRQRCHAT